MRAPRVFGKYLLLERISVGGMAEVFKAKTFGEEGFEKIIAIKRILPSMAADQDFITMFIDEARIAGQLSHANICQIHELGKIEGSHFIAMEYIQGKDVLQIQNRFRRLRRRMPLPMAALIAARVCQGLDYAHRRRDASKQPLDIIHRDVSPQNVLVSYEGEVKIIDFGIAKAISRSAKTQAGVLKGKFGYMSPEQVRGEPMDRRSDMFAIGTLLWEMCTEERLFTGPSDFAVLDKVRNASVPPPSAHNPMIPPELEAIIMRALRRDPVERYQWATDMEEALEAYLVARSPQWSNTTIAKTVKKMFQRELEREQGLLEQYRAIRKEDLAKFLSPAPAQRGRAVSLLHPRSRDEPIRRRGSAEATSELNSQDLVVDIDPERDATHVGGGVVTQVSGPLLLEELEADGPVDPGLMHVDTADFDVGATHVFGAKVSSTGGPLPAEPTFIFNTELGQMVHAADRPIYVESDAGELDSGNGHSRSDLVDQGPTVVFNLEEDEALAPPETPTGPLTSTASVVSPHSTMLKDIMIGVLSAAVLILIAVVAWSSWGPDRDLPAALVVNVSSRLGADVSVDGKLLGTVTPGRPLTLRGIGPGPHRVVLIPEQGDPVARHVEVVPGEVKVLSVALPMPRTGVPGVVADAGTARSAIPSKSPIARDAGPAADLAHAPPDGDRPDPQAVHARRDASTGAAAVAPTPRVRDDDTRVVRRRSRRRRVSGRASRRSTSAATARRRSTGRATRRRRATRAKPGYLVANTIPWARVLVDGRDTGRTTPIAPAAKIPLTPGSHRVAFIAGGKRFTFTVKIAAGQVTRLIKKLPVK